MRGAQTRKHNNASSSPHTAHIRPLHYLLYKSRMVCSSYMQYMTNTVCWRDGCQLVTRCVYTCMVHFRWLVDILMYPSSSPDSRVTGMISRNYLLGNKWKLYGHTACQMSWGILYLLQIMRSITKKSYFPFIELFYCNTIIVNVIMIVNVITTRHVTFPSTFEGMVNKQLDFMPGSMLQIVIVITKCFDFQN